MSYEKLNHYTWVAKDGKTTLQKRFSQIPEKRKQERKPSSRRNKNYTAFCKELFQDRKFISVKDLNKEISTKIHLNFTWYKKRMLALKLIKIENRVVKPGENL